MYGRIYETMKFYEELAGAELLCLRIEQRFFAGDKSLMNETKRNYLDYKGRADMLKSLLNSACKR